MWDYKFNSQGQDTAGIEKVQDPEFEAAKMRHAPSDAPRIFSLDDVLKDLPPHPRITLPQFNSHSPDPRAPSMSRQDNGAAVRQAVKAPFLLPEQPQNKINAAQNPVRIVNASPPPHMPMPPPPADWNKNRPGDVSLEWSAWNTPEWVWHASYPTPHNAPHAEWSAPFRHPNANPPNPGYAYYDGRAPPPPIAPPRWIGEPWSSCPRQNSSFSTPLHDSTSFPAMSSVRTCSTWGEMPETPATLPFPPSFDAPWSNPDRAVSPAPSIATAGPSTPRDKRDDATQHFETAIHRCAKERQWQKAVKILQDMRESPVCVPTVRAYTSAISACAKTAQSQKALELLEEMQKVGVKPNVLTYSAAISACEKARKCKIALSLLQEMKKQGIKPDVISYNAAISSCEKARKWRLALMLIQEMREEGIVKPDVISYSAAISACEKGGKLEHALDLLQEMKNQGVKPDVILYNATISACDKRGAWRQAVALLREMRTYDVEPDVISYSTAISACNRGGEADHAVMLVREMRNDHVEPNGMAFVSAINACVKQNKVTACLDLLQQMKVMGFKYEEGGEWKKALNLIRKMPDGAKYVEDLY